MSSARRPLLTATAAGTLLCALWFVPSANANQDTASRTDKSASTTSTTSTGTTTQITTRTRADGAVSESDDGTRLADTGSFDTTPYVVGGTTLLALGAGFVVYSVRRERLGF